jgi:hypothetical protein
MPDMHALLDECQTQCQTLVEEIKGMKQTRSLNEQTTETLDSTCKALQQTVTKIRPFTEVRFKRFARTMIVGTAVNSAIAIAILVILILKG